jgi:hypothetical protein
VKVYFHAFLTSAVDGGEWSVSRPVRFAPRERASGTHLIGRWVSPRAGLDTVSNPDHPIVQLVAWSLYRLSYPGSCSVSVNSEINYILTLKGKLPLCFFNLSTTPWRRIAGVEVYLHIFSISAVDGGELSASRLGCFCPRERAPGTHWIGGWVDQMIGLVYKKPQFNPLPQQLPHFT